MPPTKREVIEKKMASTHSQKEYDRLQIELDALNKKEKEDIAKAEAKEQKADAAAKKAEDKRLAAIQRQVDAEDKAYAKAEEKAKDRYDRETRLANEAHNQQVDSFERSRQRIEASEQQSIDRSTALYEKQVARLKAVWSDADLGIAPAVVQSIQHMTKDGLAELADQLSKTTVYSDDQVQAAEVMAASYDNISADVMPGLLQASADLAAKLGGDLPSATETLARVLQDPIQNMGLLRRAHVSLTTAEKDQIKEMQKHNDIAGAQNIVIKAVERSLGGMAQAMAGTYSGQTQILSNNLNQMAQTLGLALLPSLEQVNAWLIKALQDPETQKQVQQLADVIVKLGKTLIDDIILYGPQVIAFLDDFRNNLGTAQTFVSDTGDQVTLFAQRFGDMVEHVEGFLARLQTFSDRPRPADR